MATARDKKKMQLMVDLPECPVCLETLSSPIFLCKSGHSICRSCIKNLEQRICPSCRQTITDIRNRQLEDLIAGAITNCPNKESGCNDIIRCDKIKDHVKECIYRVMKCPLEILGKCSWSGSHKEIVDHFKKWHPQNILLNLDEEVTINNISVTQDDRFVYIVPQGIITYILTLQIDINQQLAYWVVQIIGIKKLLKQHIYEINIYSQQDNCLKVTYNDYCFSDAMPTAEIINQSQCFVLSLPFLNKFIYERRVSFNLKIKYKPVFTSEKNTDSLETKIEMLKNRFGLL